MIETGKYLDGTSTLHRCALATTLYSCAGVTTLHGSACHLSASCSTIVNDAHILLQAAMHEVFEDDDMRQIFRWLTKFLNNPYSEDDQLVPAGLLFCLLTSMHHSVFCFFKHVELQHVRSTAAVSGTARNVGNLVGYLSPSRVVVGWLCNCHGC